eukprot:4508881-Amphidinium_carterae.1
MPSLLRQLKTLLTSSAQKTSRPPIQAWCRIAAALCAPSTAMSSSCKHNSCSTSAITTEIDLATPQKFIPQLSQRFIA